MSILNEIENRYFAIIYTYKTIGFDNLSSHYLRENEISLIHNIVGSQMAIIQTCNRIEIYLYSEDSDTTTKLLNFLDQVHGKKISIDATILTGSKAIEHLFEVASGIDSMAIGEYEILSQVRLSLENAKKLHMIGKELEILFERAIKVGRRVRQQTNISKGKVGLYSIAIELAKTRVDLKTSNIAVIGAGQIGSRLISMLNSEGAKNVTILNRTVEKAKELAEKYGYSYLSLDFSKLDGFDVIFSAIFYPRVIRIDNKFIIDLSSPPIFQGNEVYTLKNLQQISEEIRKKRLSELSKAKDIIEEGIRDFILDYENLKYDMIVSQIMKNIEEIRQNEVKRALKELNGDNAEEVLNAMTKSMVKKMFYPLLSKIKEAVRNNETNYINLILELFNNGKLSDSKTKEIEEKQVNKRYDSRNQSN
ncbi:glutamyl-tRNA reductase [Acidianus hospitalis W1]|uniref:Glutamyl-tRNA reductase n=1 Tax=Acidianus hospitalis (strain W1) TaxID=933801 RepID=F4B728_ACIHW|nr:glutamyl-tRNA reductase [Acidianus hospitalis]AEE93511.1 glutamyl-tRNA reductase [Acidianus hospitalis W1]